MMMMTILITFARYSSSSRRWWWAAVGVVVVAPAVGGSGNGRGSGSGSGSGYGGNAHDDSADCFGLYSCSLVSPHWMWEATGSPRMEVGTSATAGRVAPKGIDALTVIKSVISKP